MAKDKRVGHHRVPLERKLFSLGIRAIEYNLRHMWNPIRLFLEIGESEHKLKHKVRIGLRYDRFISRRLGEGV